MHPRNVYLPPLHIKLDLMGDYVKAVDLNGNSFEYLMDGFGKSKLDAK